MEGWSMRNLEIAEKILTWVKKELDKEQLPPDPQRRLFE